MEKIYKTDKVPFGYAGWAFWPLIVIKPGSSIWLLNHERIHHAQQKELWLIFFILIYFAEYFYGLFKYRSHDKAYRAISFEREAYDNQYDLSYIEKKERFSFVNYM